MPDTTLPPSPRNASATAFDNARQQMLAAYREAIQHMSAMEAALEAEATSSAMRQLFVLLDA